MSFTDPVGGSSGGHLETVPLRRGLVGLTSVVDPPCSKGEVSIPLASGLSTLLRRSRWGDYSRTSPQFRSRNPRSFDLRITDIVSQRIRTGGIESLGLTEQAPYVRHPLSMSWVLTVGTEINRPVSLLLFNFWRLYLRMTILCPYVWCTRVQICFFFTSSCRYLLFCDLHRTVHCVVPYGSTTVGTRQ